MEEPRYILYVWTKYVGDDVPELCDADVTVSFPTEERAEHYLFNTIGVGKYWVAIWPVGHPGDTSEEATIRRSNTCS